MLFKKEKGIKSIKDFDPSKCQTSGVKVTTFKDDDVAMGCSQNCWSTCIGFPNR